MRWVLNGAAFAAGFGTLGLEIVALRMLAPYFGASVDVSGTVISTVLVLLTLGYFIGGALADRRPIAAWPLRLLAGAGVAVLLSVLWFPWLLQMMAAFPTGFGAAAATLVLFGLPMIGMSMVAPSVVRLTARSGVGHAAGRVSAVGTSGAISGSLLVTFVFIPDLGVRQTLVIVGGVILMAGTAGMLAVGWRSALTGLLALLVLVPAGFLGSDEAPGEVDTLFAADSLYGRVRVLEDRNGYRRLVLNQTRWTQSVDDALVRTSPGSYFEVFDTGPALGNGNRALIIGMGAGTSASRLLRAYPDLQVDAVEIDPTVVSVARDYFDLPEDPRLVVIIADGRRFLRSTDARYHFIELDVYQGGPHIPYYLVTREAFTQIRARLFTDGVLMTNVISPQGSLAPHLLVDAIGVTMQSVFGAVFAADLGANTVLVATATEVTLEELLARVPVEGPSASAGVTLKFLLQPFTPVDSAIPLTDDKAPLEDLTRRLLSGGT